MVALMIMFSHQFGGEGGTAGCVRRTCEQLIVSQLLLDGFSFGRIDLGEGRL
jgi:hypothetical protein